MHDSNTCVCCGRDIPEGVQVCKFCERDANIPPKNKLLTKDVIINIFRVSTLIILAVLVVLSLCSCNMEPSTFDFSIGGVDFTCIEAEYTSNVDYVRLFVCDQTGVIYIEALNGFSQLCNSDGTPMTLDDYKSIKSDSLKYREDK